MMDILLSHEAVRICEWQQNALKWGRGMQSLPRATQMRGTLKVTFMKSKEI